MDFNQLSCKGIIFDFDGTLIKLNVDYTHLKSEIESMLFKKFKIKTGLTPLLFKLKSIKKMSNSAYEKASDMIKRAEIKALKTSPVKELLVKFIKKSDKKIAIFTVNFRETVEKFLQNQSISNIGLIIGNQEVKNHKPDPEGLKTILKQWGIKKNQVIFVGDSINDQLAGQAINLKTILI